MKWNPSVRLPAALLRYREEDLAVLSSADIEAELKESAAQFRAFSFFPDADLSARLSASSSTEEQLELFIPLRNGMIDEASVDEPSVRRRFYSQGRISSRLLNGLLLIHRAISDTDNPLLTGRRFVLIKERPGSPTIYHISTETSLLSYVNAGPPEREQATIYIGLNLVDVVMTGLKEGNEGYYRTFVELLKIEERAIETGYAHTEPLSAPREQNLNALLDRIISLSEVFQSRSAPLPGKARPFTAAQRGKLLEMLDARLPGESGPFDYEVCRRAVEELEKLARKYKTHNDTESLREVIRLLVAASGHDIHEVRNRASIALERTFSPKEFDAPLATKFASIKAGTRYTFEFDLPKSRSGYFLRVYGDRSSRDLIVDGELDYADLELKLNPESGRYETDRLFRTLGNYDWLVFRAGKNGGRWIDGCSGRLNVLPDLDGEVVLEIFPDIHGHTRLYWKTPNPGMVYNEMGQIIRTGTFTDITAHLAEIKARYAISAVYILGAQKRGSNREDWAPEAQSPSPFAPMSMTELEPALGGEEAFKALVDEAHRLDIRVIVDVIPHLNRQSNELAEEYAVRCYDEAGNLGVRASTDGRYGSWNDGKLLNYRKFAVWEWLADSVCTLIERYDVDGIRFDSAHAVPVMMRRNNYPFIHGEYRSRESMVEGEIIDNTREFDHLVTTGYYDSAGAELIAVPFHYYLSLRVHRLLRRMGKKYFVNLAECYWGREQYLARTGTVPYNSALFKICENIVHGKTDVREIYHIYHNHFPTILPEGAHMLGILGNHDERRALNTFGPRGLKAAAMLTSFLSSIILDYEGSAEGESWKVYLDNIYVNWNDFEREAYRGTVDFYRELYREHRGRRGPAYLIWAGNTMVAAALRFSGDTGHLGAFNFADMDQHVSLRFDDPRLPLEDDVYYRISDPVYSAVTGSFGWYTGAELRGSVIETFIPHTDRFKLLTLQRVADPAEQKSVYTLILEQSFYRLCSATSRDFFSANFAFRELKRSAGSYRKLKEYLTGTVMPLLEEKQDVLHLALKRFFFHLRGEEPGITDEKIWSYILSLESDSDGKLAAAGAALRFAFRGGSVIFLSAEADPFSKSGGLANVVYELPRELALLGEQTVVITPLYRSGDDKSVRKMEEACRRYGVSYSGRTVHFWIEEREYEVGVHTAEVDGIRYYLLDHHEFFDGLYFGVTGAERLRRRIAFSRASAELIRSFELDPLVIFTNDAFAGIFTSIVRGDPSYNGQAPFDRASLAHIIHNGGWQYFDAYHRWEQGFDLFRLFNLPAHEVWRFEDPTEGGRINCMAAGIRGADKVVTVSPSYAEQIKVAADGMEGILHDVIGINNGVGNDFRSRACARLEEEGFLERNSGALQKAVARDPVLKRQLESSYPELLKPGAVEALKRGRRRRILERMRIKLLLQQTRGLQVDPEAPLFVMIHRLTEQKGFQLLLEASAGIFSLLGYQGIIGGAVAGGDERGEEFARGLRNLETYFPKQVSVGIGFQDVRIPLLGADLFLMPSMHEPGGISQLEAFACGSFVCARATGGLKDTVHPMVSRGRRVEGNGVLFSDYSAPAFYDAMQRFHALFTSVSPDALSAARERMIGDVYSWRQPAERYRDLIYTMKEIVPGGGE